MIDLVLTSIPKKIRMDFLICIHLHILFKPCSHKIDYMKCYTHNNKDAVGQCGSCGKGICSDCAVDLNKKLFCRGCASSGNASASRNISLTRRDPGMAALLSFIFIGAGQIYNGQLGKFLLLWGINFAIVMVSIILMVVLIGFFTIFLVIPVWLYGIYDAYRSAKEINIQLGVE